MRFSNSGVQNLNRYSRSVMSATSHDTQGGHHREDEEEEEDHQQPLCTRRLANDQHLHHDDHDRLQNDRGGSSPG